MKYSQTKISVRSNSKNLAFTLIELLAVIIILAIVALIATPLILDVIDDASKSANKSQVELLLKGAENLYASSILNDDYKSLINDTNIYSKELFKTSGELPGVGVLKIRNNGEIYLSVHIDGICYVKDYNKNSISESEVLDPVDCIPLTVILNPSNSSTTTWYGEDLEVSFITNGDSYKYCISDSICTPDTLVSNTTGSITLTETKTVCAVGVKNNSESNDKSCVEYKIDKTTPTITDKGEDVVIEKGDNIDVSTYFEADFGPNISGNIVCEPQNTSGLEINNQIVKCKAVGDNGLESAYLEKSIQVDEPCTDVGVNVSLTEGLIPVVISANGTVSKANLTDGSYYSYCDQKWANAVMIKKEDKRIEYQNNQAGTNIELEDIAAYYVWIPRYEYQIFDTDTDTADIAQEINIRFVDSNSTNKMPQSPTMNEYYTHPAFTFGDDELAGFWIGKFELTGSEEMPTVLPKSYAIKSMNLSELFDTIIDMDIDYGVTNADSHMIKNMEWGAVAYLSHSKYGVSDEIWINNSFVTGCGAESNSAIISVDCIIHYGTVDIYNQSTTGNISGVFDMSGGNWEHVMGNMSLSSTEHTFFSSSSGFTTEPATKYYDSYLLGYTENDSSAYERGLFGDATRETISWYGDDALFLNPPFSWFARGGASSSLTYAGVFAFAWTDGSTDGGAIASRPVVAVYP